MTREQIDVCIQELLCSRGYDTIEKQRIFLQPDFDRDSYSPGLLPDCDRAVSRVLRAVHEGERIAIYADFDCDGIPAAVVMHDFFKKIAYDNVRVYIPHRDTEGFGVHCAAIDSLRAEGVTLVITVDVGSSAHEAVAHAQQCGVDVIVTDHHEVDHVLPPAHAVVNPKRVDVDVTYPFPHLCGSGVAFQLVRAILAEGKNRALPAFVSVPEGWEKWLLDMVGLATIADMVPLVGENRVFAHFGLLVLTKSRRPGLQALCSIAKIDQRYITEETVGYTLAPRINAASRMGNPDIAFELFATTDPVRAQELAKQLERLNNERKGLVGSIAKAAHSKIEERYIQSVLPSVVVLGDPDWRPAVLGSVAATLAETYARPFFLWGREGTGILKGSCRSHGGVDVLAVMTRSSHMLLHHGGHKMAGGFAVMDTHVHALQETFVHAHADMACTLDEGAVSDAPSVSVPQQPLQIRAPDVSQSTVRQFRKLAPFGVGNPEIHITLRGTVHSVGQFGKEKNHFEMQLKEGAVIVRCMSFFASPSSFTCAPEVGDVVSVVGALTETRFAGRVRIEVRIEDIVCA